MATHSEDFVILACTVLIQITSVTDGQIDDGYDARSILLSRVKRKEKRRKRKERKELSGFVFPGKISYSYANAKCVQL